MINNITILGAGTMGHGIAQVCSMVGYQTTLYDISEDTIDNGLTKINENLQKGVLRGKVTTATQILAQSCLNGCADLKEAVQQADLVIEAVPENLALKQNLFSKVDRFTPEHTIMGTNTSSISIADIAQAVSDPSKMIGLHFFNPVHIMKLLEIVHHSNTSQEVITICTDFANKIGKESILVNNIPGFATSRLGVALGMEAIRMLEEKVASAEDIDTAMVLGYKHPIGPLKLTDLIGLDVRMAIGEYLASELNNPAFNPPKLLKTKVANGELGKKTGKGFYTWK
jgi:3-hydroxybutyryl-CoA dehydrogenase